MTAKLAELAAVTNGLGPSCAGIGVTLFPFRKTWSERTIR